MGSKIGPAARGPGKSQSDAWSLQAQPPLEGSGLGECSHVFIEQTLGMTFPRLHSHMYQTWI